MTLKRLRDLIRIEAQAKGSDTLVGLIDITINEVLRSKTALQQYQELLIVDSTLVPSATNNPNFTLPSSLQHFLQDSVRYSIGGAFADAFYLYRIEQKDSSTTSGSPSSYYRAANITTVSPSQVGITDRLIMDYYKYPDELINDADVFPIPNLLATVKLETASRITQLTNTKLSQILRQNAQQAYSESCATTK